MKRSYQLGLAVAVALWVLIERMKQSCNIIEQCMDKLPAGEFRAAKLPKVDLHRPPAAIGRNTVHSIQSGLLFGYVGLVEGMVTRFRAELGPKMKVIGTGGLAEVIVQETKVIDIIAPWLTLDGLKIVWELNQK